MSTISPGKRFRLALAQEKPLQIVGTINAYTAMLAKRAGYKAIYLSGAGVANASYGLPDIGITNLDNVLIDAARITSAVDLPLLVDVDTGWGSAFNIARMVQQMIKAEVAAVHLEDQVQAKRCGHRPGKALVSTAEMQDRIKSAVDARIDPDFVIMARTDALAVEGLAAAIERAQAYVAVGADMIFAEAVTTLDEYQTFVKAVNVPILANITEFGKTPLFTIEELRQSGVNMALYPLSAFRGMSAVALDIYQTIRNTGTQKSVIDKMQPRTQLYEVLNYPAYEEMLDRIVGKEEKI